MRTDVRITIWLLLPFLLSCSSVSVSSDYDQATKFDKLQTYAWMTGSEEKPGGRPTNTIAMARFHTAIERELDKKGYRKTTERPDFLVAYHTSIDEKTLVHSVPNYGPGPGFYHAGVGYQDVYQTQYEEGTLIIDIVDPRTKNLLWRGIAKAAVDSLDDPEKKTQQTNEAVQKILEKFPP